MLPSSRALGRLLLLHRYSTYTAALLGAAGRGVSVVDGGAGVGGGRNGGGGC